MEIEFELGTLLAHFSTEETLKSDLIGRLMKDNDWTWDPRVNSYRAPAWKFNSILTNFAKLQYTINEKITQKFKLAGYQKKTIELRHYQAEAHRHWYLHDCRGVVVMPTGTGKTRLALFAINELQLKTLILVPTRVLLYQWHHELKEKLEIPIGILGDGKNVIHSITVSTYESAIRLVPKIGDHFGFVILDEAHHFLRGEKIEIVEMLCAPYCLSLSATFEYNEESKVKHLLGPIAFRLTLDEIQDNALSPYDKIKIFVKLSESEQRDYNWHINNFTSFMKSLNETTHTNNQNEIYQLLGKSINGRRASQSLKIAKRIVYHCNEKIKKLEKLLFQYANRRILIFTADSEMALKISQELLVFAVLAETPKKERDLALKYFSDGQLNCIVACRVLNEGYDLPTAEVAIIIGGALGKREFLQRIGRVLRPLENKRALIIELICQETFEVNQSRRRNHGP